MGPNSVKLIFGLNVEAAHRHSCVAIARASFDGIQAPAHAELYSRYGKRPDSGIRDLGA